MKSLLPSLIGRIFMLVCAVGIFLYTTHLVDNMNVTTVINEDLNKKLDITYEVIERDVLYVYTSALPEDEVDIIKAGSDGLIAYYGGKKTILSEPIKEIAWMGTSNEERIEEILSYDKISTFNALITGYGPDCRGCRGITATGYDVRNTTFYNDKEFGDIRIVAADADRYRYGSVMRVMDYRDWDPFLVIMLDCGGAINNNDLDLLYPTETLGNRVLGLDTSVHVDIIRSGY